MILRFGKFFIIFLLLGLLFSCAKKEAPSGGPKDKTAPKIIFSKPISGQLNVGQSPKIEIGFSERMKRNAVKSVLSWRPAVKNVKTSWVGNTLIIQPQDTLITNRTYLLTISGISDYHGIKTDSVFTLAFSTGAILDSCSVLGKIYHNDKPLASAIIRLYEKSDTTKAAYFTTSLSNGYYVLRYLKKSAYRLLAFEDTNGNNEFDFGEEAGIDTTLSFAGKITNLPNFDLHLAITDTTPPFLQEAESIDNSHLRIKFSEPMAPERIFSIENYAIADTIGNPLKIFDLLEGEDKKRSVIFHTEEQIADMYIIRADSTISDLSGHILGENNYKKFIAKDYPDTIAPEITDYYPKDNALLNKVYPLVFSIDFNDFMDKKLCESAFSLKETARGKAIKGKFKWKGETEMQFHIDDMLEWVMQYTVIVDTIAADAAGNRLRSKLEWKVLTVPKKE